MKCELCGEECSGQLMIKPSPRVIKMVCHTCWNESLNSSNKLNSKTKPKAK